MYVCIQSWPLQPFSQEIVSHSTVGRLSMFIRKSQDLQFEVDCERQMFEKLFIAILFTLRDFARNSLRGSHRRIFYSYYCWRNLMTIRIQRLK